MKRLIIVTILGFLIPPLFTAPLYASKNALTLSEAWELMQVSDPALKASAETIAESKGVKTQAMSAFLPQLKGDVYIRHYMKEQGFIWNSGNFGMGTVAFPATEDTIESYGVGLYQTVFDSGKSIAQFKEAGHGLKAATHYDYANRQNRAVQLVEAYSSYYLAKINLEVAEASHADLAKHFHVAKLRYEQGLAPKTDMLAAQVASDRASIEVKQASDDLDISRERLFTMIGRYPDKVAKPEVPEPPVDLETPDERPEIMGKSAEIDAARSEALKEKLSYLPELYFKADAQYVNDDFLINKDQYTFIGGVSLPLFDGALHIGKMKAAKAKEYRGKWEREAMLDVYSVELERAKRIWNRSDSEIKTERLNMTRAAENLKNVRLSYSEGVVSALEVRDAVRLWKESVLGYHKSICNQQLASAKLRQAAGRAVLGGQDVD